MLEEDHSNLQRSDPSILNVLAATRYSRNWRVKTRGRSTYSTSLLENSPSIIVTSGLSFTSVQTARAHWLAADAVYPFGIHPAVFGTDRLNPWLWALTAVGLCWHAIRLRSGSDIPPQPYGRTGSSISALEEALGTYFTDDVGLRVQTRHCKLRPTDRRAVYLHQHFLYCRLVQQIWGNEAVLGLTIVECNSTGSNSTGLKQCCV